jgi:hypothetical protein
MNLLILNQYIDIFLLFLEIYDLLNRKSIVGENIESEREESKIKINQQEKKDPVGQKDKCC